MDDPWGSPWTSADRIAAGLRPSLSPEPVAKHPFSLPAQPSWADADADEGFDDWETASDRAASPRLFDAAAPVALAKMNVSELSVDPWSRDVSSAEELPASTSTLVDSCEMADASALTKSSEASEAQHERASIDTAKTAMESEESLSEGGGEEKEEKEEQKEQEQDEQESGPQSSDVKLRDGAVQAPGNHPPNPRPGGPGQGGEAAALDNESRAGLTDEHSTAHATRDSHAVGAMQTANDEQMAVLFGAATEAVAASDDCSMPKYMISDSFTCIAERKAWYRVSRQGSSRRHEAGDDSSYRRVAWPRSTVRAKTVKIVRRWMEQDSFTGRPILGTGGVRGSAFGWDSAAKPVALDQVYKRLSRPQSLSLASPTDCSSPLSSPATARSSVRFDCASLASPTTPDRPDSAKPETPLPTPSFSLPRPGSGLKILTLDASILEDDDEWGEMISSPVASSPYPASPQIDSVANVLHADHAAADDAPATPTTPASPATPAAVPTPDSSVPETAAPAVAKQTEPAFEEFIQSVLCGLPDLSYMAR